MSSPSYNLVAEMETDRYQITVYPKCGKPVTLYVQKASTEHNGNPYHWRRGVVRADMWLVKASPTSRSYFTAYMDFEKAIISANIRARRIGRAWSKPIKGASK